MILVQPQYLPTVNFFKKLKDNKILVDFNSDYSHFLNINKIINNDKFNIIKKNSFIFLSPFTAFFSFKFSIFFSKVERILLKFLPGFLLFIEIEKK